MDAETVRRCARLARLELDPAELERTTAALAVLLSDIAALRALRPSTPPAPSMNAAAVGDTAPAETPDTPDPLDVPVSYLAPEWRDGYFTVSPAAAGRPPQNER